MVDIHIKDKKDDILYKDCDDFVPLDDGTITGERKYCNLSFQCKQVGMASDYVQVCDGLTGEVIEFDYLCTGKHTIFEERTKDEEAE